MANPKGVNRFGGFTSNSPYGSVKIMEENQRSAPLAGEPFQALTGPDNLRRQAARRGGSPQAAPAAQAPPAIVNPVIEDTYDTRMARFWDEAASMPGASALIREYADKVRSRAVR